MDESFSDNYQQVVFIPSEQESKNIYQTEEYDNSYGWIILSSILAVILLIFIILWVVAIDEQHMCSNTNMSCFGPYGVETGIDANPLNQCGTNRTSPCIFAKGTIADCEAECDNLISICSAFTFNSSTSTMKIVDRSNVFVSTSSDLFVRQN